MRQNHENNTGRILFITGILLLISELWKQYVINCTLQSVPGGYDWWYFPFQLCSTPMVVCLLFPLFEKKEDLRSAALTYLSCYGLLAGICAFLDTGGFTELGYLPLTVHSWVWHIVLILLGLYSARVLCLEKDGNLAGATLFFLAGCMIAEIINALVGDRGVINMFYINPRYRMAQVVFKDIAAYAGNGTAIISYILCIIVGAMILYLIRLLYRDLHFD